MKLETVLADIAKATVKMLPLSGQGVLIKGGFVLTASHCVRALTTDGYAPLRYPPMVMPCGAI
jgi:hypothetical protein